MTDPLPKYAVQKLDGIHVRCKSGHVITARKHNLWEKCGSPALPDEWFDAELCCDGPAELVKSALKQRRPVELRPFSTDALEIGATYADMQDYFDLRLPLWFEDLDETPESMLEIARKRRWEGWVFSEGNRTLMTKLKVVNTIDLIVVGFTEGKGKYLGLTGSLICATNEGYVVANVSGMDEHTRICISTVSDFHRIVEVKYDRVGSAGRLRFPRFIRWRDDKEHAGCGVGQDQDLEAYYG